MTASSILKALALSGLLACLAATAHAQAPKPNPSIPSVLVPWIPWVLEDAGDAPCTNIGSVRHCVWPTSLSLDAKDKGATFTLNVSVDRQTQVTLPGSAEHWPLDVRVGVSPAVVIEPSGSPEVLLPAGSHVIQGRFEWSALPDSLQVPVHLGTLSLTVLGARVTAPKREASGLLWLAQGGQSKAETERLELSVHRRIDDGVPLRITTRIQVSAAGTARELVLPNVLVEGTRAIELRAELPAQLAADGSLRLQAQAGSYRIEVIAIQDRPVDVLRAPQAASPWPEQEYWVFAADDVLRHVELPTTGQIDASRTDLAPDWHNLQTFVVPPGGSLTLTTRRRGEPEPPPNELSLERAMWLDLDGRGYTVRDTLHGTMHRDFRLDLRSGVLGHAVVDGKDELVTERKNLSGIELRRGNLNLNAEWRMDGAARDLPAVGWSEDVRSLSTTLNLPPGFLLLGAEGVDDISETWLARWDLWDFFFVLLVALAVGKLAGAAWGLLALCTLVLSHHEPDAPAAIWLFLLAATALLRVVRAPRWESVARVLWGAGLVALLLVAVPFSVAQLRKAIYPQVDSSINRVIPEEYASLVMAPDRPASEPAAPGALQDESGMREAAEEAAADLLEGSNGKASGDVAQEQRPRGGKAGSFASWQGYSSENHVDPQAVVQTGPGVPTWSWRTISMSWSGPVQRDQHIKLWLVPPFATRAWSLLTVLLNFALLLALARASTRRAPPSIPPAAAALLLFGLLLPVSQAQAQAPKQADVIPPADVLETLKTRLLKPAECEPNCLSVPKLALSIEGARLLLRAEIHAGAQGSYQAPGPLESWAPDSIKVDGKPALAAARFDDGFLHVRLGPGRHIVELAGNLPPSQTLTLALGTAPHRVEARAPGFVIEGLRANGRAEGSLALRREVAIDPALGPAHQTLMQWLDVKRSFDLGVRFRVVTTLRRLGPATDSMLVRFPLLPGESVTEAGLTSENGSVVIQLGRDQAELSFASTLRPSAQIALEAAAPADAGGHVLQPWTETWQVTCATMYHCSFDGLAPITRLSNGMFQPLYRPWPGEKLTIRTERVDGAPGSSVTIDTATLTLTPGSRLEQGNLSFNARTSRGSTQRVTLPAQATLVSLQVDGVARTARVKEGAVELHLDPGSHSVNVEFQRAFGITQRYTSPKVRVGQALTNVTTRVNVPRDRWLLWAYGPSWGPAILFWGYLALVVLAGLALSRVPVSPLKTHEWLLLGLGLTQVEAPIVLIIIAWLFALAFRERQTLSPRWAFNLGQIGLVLFTLVALACLAFAVHQGLVVQPDMQVQGMDSSNMLLNWYVDRTGGGFPSVGIVSLPLWIYKSLMLVWALWLAASLLRWLRWGFQAFRHDGAWKSAPENPRVALDEIEAARAELAASKKTT